MSTVSSKELFILGRVSLRPTHGHEIMTTLRASHADLWVELSEKHVYYVLKKLQRDGLIASNEQRGDRLPARKVYAITEPGRTALAEMLSADILVQATPYSEFDVVFGMLCYTDALSPAEKDAVLVRRRAALVELLASLEQAASDPPDAGAPQIMLAKVTRNVAHELGWLDEVVSAIHRDGWDSMRPVFGSAGAASTDRGVIS